MRYRLLSALAASVALTSTMTPAAADPTISSDAWNAYVRANDVGKCFPHFLPLYGPVDMSVPPLPLVAGIPHAEYDKLRFGPELRRGMATTILPPPHEGDPFAQQAVLSAERDGDVVGVVVLARWTARGFFEASEPSPPLNAGRRDDGEALRSHFAAYLKYLPQNQQPETSCGLTIALLSDDTNQDNSVQLVVRGHEIIGGLETYNPPDPVPTNPPPAAPASP